MPVKTQQARSLVSLRQAINKQLIVRAVMELQLISASQQEHSRLERDPRPQIKVLLLQKSWQVAHWTTATMIESWRASDCTTRVEPSLESDKFCIGNLLLEREISDHTGMVVEDDAEMITIILDISKSVDQLLVDY